MPKKEHIRPLNFEQAAEMVASRLEDTSGSAYDCIYFNGWRGLVASAVLRAIAKKPPASLRKRFNKIIHIDCSRWQSRRALQREIVEQLQLQLPQRVTDILDRQDEEDDFSGVPQDSRAEIRVIAEEIHQALQQDKCLVIFHNGSSTMVDLTDFGIPLSNNMILWTFRGRLRLNTKIQKKVDISHLFLDVNFRSLVVEFFLIEEATEIAWYTGKTGVTHEIVFQCCLYLLALNHKGGNTMDYSWVIHASNYWVCDGIIQGGQDNNEQAWEVATAIHQELRLEDYSSSKNLPPLAYLLSGTSQHWVFATELTTVPLESTSFFLAAKNKPDIPLPDGMFHRWDKLRVLKLQHCTFNFTSPPFNCCCNLRFLGLDRCKDQEYEEKKNEEKPPMEFFRILWVLDICYMDWELILSQDIIEKMATNIRDIHIKHGRIWGNNFRWQRLQNLRKLRLIDRTCPLQTTGDKDEFIDMVKLELLDLSRNSEIQVLPSLSEATSLKTLILDGCTGLQCVGPEGLPPSLELFSFEGGSGEDQNKEAKISQISLAGCARLVNFRLCGLVPNLEKLDLSGTSIKKLDLQDEAVKVARLEQIILLGCKQLRSILWPKKRLPRLRLLCIDTRGGGEVRKKSPDCLVHHVQEEYCQAYVATTDIRFVQSLLIRSGKQFCWITDGYILHLCISRTGNGSAKMCNKDKTGPYSTGQIIGLPQRKSSIPSPCYYPSYADIPIDKITSGHDDSSTSKFQPLNNHLEIGDGESHKELNMESVRETIIFTMNKVESMHVHDNSFITTVIPERMMSIKSKYLKWDNLKQCRIERCPKMHTIFPMKYNISSFQQLETFSAADLLIAHCIWSKRRTSSGHDTISFRKLRSIHLHSCPRLVFVLPLTWAARRSYLPNLETLHIAHCDDLRHVFPVERELLSGTLEFPKLKDIFLYDLPSLQHICETKMSAPMLESILVRGCWGLKRLPAIGGDRRRPVVHCEKELWEKLEWDGLHVGHHPSLFDVLYHTSQYYKKPLPRGSVLK